MLLAQCAPCLALYLLFVRMQLGGTCWNPCLKAVYVGLCRNPPRWKRRRRRRRKGSQTHFIKSFSILAAMLSRRGGQHPLCTLLLPSTRRGIHPKPSPHRWECLEGGYQVWAALLAALFIDGHQTSRETHKPQPSHHNAVHWVWRLSSLILSPSSLNSTSSQCRFRFSQWFQRIRGERGEGGSN